MMTTMEMIDLLPWQTFALLVCYIIFTFGAIIYVLTKLK